MNHDVFISYSHKTKAIVDRIVSKLENSGIKVWYAPRDVIGDYATAIVEAIETTKVFVVVLNGDSSKSPQVLNEVEIAYKRIIEDEANLSIMPFKISDETLSKAMEYYVKRMHWIDASSSSLDDGIDELIVKVKTIVNPKQQTSNVDENKREANTWYTTTNEDEFKRLRLQQKFLHDFDGKVYEKALEGLNDANILDIGTSDGTYIYDCIPNLSAINKVVGVDYNPTAISKANANTKSDKFVFEVADAEAQDFEEKLRGIMDKNGIESFDLINISMVLLHLKFPEKVLKILRHYLKPNGSIVIKDVDDGLKVAYPDPEGLFEKCKNLSINDKYGGFRMSGRQIPYFLHKAGYRDIKIVKSGIDTLGKDYDQKEGFFDFVVPYIRDDFKQLSEENPNNEFYKEGYEWMESNLERMHDLFMEDGFYYSLGTMLFVAKR